MDIRTIHHPVAERVFGISELVFKISFLLYGLATFNSFTAQTRLISVLLLLTTASAGITLLYRLVCCRRFIHNKLLWLSFAFLASYILSLVLNFQYANINSFKTLAFMGMQFCLLLATDDRRSFAAYKSELTCILRIFSAYMAAAALASIILMLCGYSDIAKRNGQTILSGFVWGRLWGVFTDPNYAAVMSALAVTVSLYALSQHKQILLRVLYIANICLQITYIAFSDSRTGCVLVFLALAVYFYLRLAALRLGKGRLAKNALCLAAALLIACVGVTSVHAVKRTYNHIVSSLAQKEPEADKDAVSDKSTLGREQDIEQDISNRRFDLWYSALETVKLRPIFGVSFESVADFAEEHLPDTYLINNDHGRYNNYHNVFFNILTGQGLVGIAVFLVMVVYAALLLIKTLYRAYGTEHYLLCALIFTLLAIALASSMFVSDIIYTISVNMMLFWYLLGIMLAKSREDAACYKKPTAGAEAQA